MSTPAPAIEKPQNFLQVFAVILLAVIGTGAFVLSFKALRDVWVGIGSDEITSWVFPIIIDGSILAATVAIVFLSAYEKRHADRIYSWFVLLLFSGVSIWLNAVHVTLSPDRKFDMTTSALISAAPPVALMLTIHLIAILIHRQKKRSGSLNKAVNKDGEVVTGAKKKTDAQIIGIVKQHVAKGREVKTTDMQKWTGATSPQSASHTLRRLKAEYPDAFGVISSAPAEQEAIEA